MRYVAFIRNINVGQTRFPNRLQLEQAFLAAGAHTFVAFRSNGTVLTDLDDSANPGTFAAGVRESLQLQCNFSEPIFLRELDALRKAVELDPYAAIDCTGYPHRYVSYYEFAEPLAGIFPLESAKHDCLVFSGTGQEAYSIARDIRGVSGYPTPLLEKRLNVPATTRSWSTLVRLIARAGS